MKTYEEIKEIFDYSFRSEHRTKFKNKLNSDYAFFEGAGKWNYSDIGASLSGEGQWLSSDLSAVRGRKQSPVTNNLIHPQIKSLEGLEINTRSYVSFKPHHYSEEAQKLCDALTELGRTVQESEDFSRHKTLVFRDCLVCGLGWMELFVEPGIFSDIEYKFKRIHPLDVIFDYDSTEHDLSDIKFLFKRNFIHRSKFEKKYSKIKKSNSTFHRSVYDDSFFSLSDSNIFRDKVLTFTFYEKVYKNFYSVKYLDGYGEEQVYFTFSKTEAKKLAKKNEIKEIPGEQIFKYEIYNGEILESYPLEPIDPRIKDFPVVPAVFERRSDYPFIPDGLVSKMKNAQMQINRTLTKATHEASANRTIITAPNITSDALNSIKENVELDPTLLIIPSPNMNVHSIPNIDISNSHLKLNEFATRSIKEQTNIHNEFLGQQTFAGQSGIAISRLQSGSLRSLVGFFSPLHLMQLRIMRIFLTHIQNQKNLHVSIRHEGKDVQNLLLNHENEHNGKAFVHNDFSNLLMGVFIDYSGSEDSLPSEMREKVERLLAMPNSLQILTNEHVLRLLGIPNAEDIAESFKTMMQPQQEQQQQIDPRQLMALQGQQN